MESTILLEKQCFLYKTLFFGMCDPFKVISPWWASGTSGHISLMANARCFSIEHRFELLRYQMAYMDIQYLPRPDVIIPITLRIR